MPPAVPPLPWCRGCCRRGGYRLAVAGVVCGRPSAGDPQPPPLACLAHGGASLRLGVRGCQSPAAVGGGAGRGAGREAYGSLATTSDSLLEGTVTLPNSVDF